MSELANDLFAMNVCNINAEGLYKRNFHFVSYFQGRVHVSYR